MLVLSRGKHEKIYIGDNITVTIADIQNGKVRIGIDAPEEMVILRAELVGNEREGRTER